MRAVVRLTLLAIWLAAALLVGVVVRMVPPARKRRIRRVRATRLAASALCRIVGMRVRASGPAPEPPFWLVANHLGYVDIPLLASLTGGIFVSKAEVRRWPVIGWVTALYSTLFLDRRNIRELDDTNRRMSEVVRRGDGLIFFPEGTSTNGASVRRFHASLLAPAASRGDPVHCASISYRVPQGWPPASNTVCWWGDMTFSGHLYSLLRLPFFEASVHFESEPVRAFDRKALAIQLQERVETHFSPVQGTGSL